MIIEAVLQVTPSGREVESIHIEQTQITKAIIVQDDPTGIETLLQLIQNSELEASGTQGKDESWQFIVMSCSDGFDLEKNSSGRVRVRYSSSKRYDASKGQRGSNCYCNLFRKICHYRLRLLRIVDYAAGPRVSIPSTLFVNYRLTVIAKC